MRPALRVRDLVRRYGPIDAVAGLGFEVAPGEIFGLLGPNGAGKTTTIEAIAGLVAPDAGEVEIGGVDARGNARAARQRIGIALQTTGLQDRITPREALRLFASFYADAAPPEPLLDRFGLSDIADRAFATLSGGQKQRLALALAFVNDPALIILDEPTAGLDPQMRAEVRGEVLKMRGEGRAVLLATHDMDEAEQLCDRVAVVDRGRIVAQGSPRELIAGSRGALGVTVETAAAPAWSVQLPSVGEVTAREGRARFTVLDLNRALGELAAALAEERIAITRLSAERASLEEVIIELTREGA